MLESWIQWTCDGCGATETLTEPNITKPEARAILRRGGWHCWQGLDFCQNCVARGRHKKRKSIFDN